MLDKKLLCEALFQHLKKIRRLSFTATSLSSTGWNGTGEASIEVLEQGNQIIFKEIGSWTSDKDQTFSFNNTFRWTLGDNHISLEHLRFGKEHPVFLFYLVPKSKTIFESEDPHLCNQDTYTGKLELFPEGFHLQWQIQGPKKEEKIDYTYL